MTTQSKSPSPEQAFRAMADKVKAEIRGGNDPRFGSRGLIVHLGFENDKWSASIQCENGEWEGYWRTGVPLENLRLIEDISG